jgi:hypothetical protein
MSSYNYVNLILEFHKIYDGHRDSRLWFLDELDANNYKEYHKKYSAVSKEKFILLQYVDCLSYLAHL